MTARIGDERCVEDGAAGDPFMDGDACCLDPRGALKAGLAIRIVLKNGAKSALVVETVQENAEFPHKIWSRLGDLNPGPTHYECVALPLS